MPDPLRAAILSLLAIRPMSGYDVRRTYQRAMQQIWYAPIGQIYPTLRTMQGEGLLEADVHIQQDRPNRKEYRLGEAGGRALADWLDLPAALPRMHHEFIHKLFLLDRMAPDRRLRFVEDYIATCSAWARQLAEVDAKFSRTPHGDYEESAACQLLALRHLRRLVDCEIASARDILDQLGSAPARPQVVRGGHGRAALWLADLTMIARAQPGDGDAGTDEGSATGTGP
jgi:DNA-binding PadR family transcriptional regulator